MRRLILFFAVAALVSGWIASRITAERLREAAAGGAFETAVRLKPNSVRFAVIGDSGTGHKEQYETASQMATYRTKFPFEFVIMLGDNIYGGGASAERYKSRFEWPYKPLLDAGVRFYAALGNHDDPNERFYKPFNMGGNRYYAYTQGNVRFLVLDSNYMDPQQIQWLEKELRATDSPWKICYFHHPLWSSGRFHGPDTDLRLRLEPLFEQYGVNVVLAGHEHVYERIKPQNGVYYFTVGNSGELRRNNLRPTALTAAGFDKDRSFMMVEIAGDEFYFDTISRTGERVDSGVLERQSREFAARGESGAPCARRSSSTAVSAW